ncbi:MAG TPA: class I SAM-dependent methyltransferase [Vicinamibacterales bacterium]|jgi:ubiquinone/menaquinone biosynthesis C-methylase UbiE
MKRRGDYGYDAPYALVSFAALGTACAVASLVMLTIAGQRHLASTLAIYAAFFLLNAGSFLYTTKRGKLQVWDEIVNRLGIRGDERVLDMGCGRGAVLTTVARRLTSGRATGVDLWSAHDQSGNAAEATLRNCELEGVRDRIDIATGDMRAVPCASGTFDVVVSSLAIHNIRGSAGRAQAVTEAWRVLKPGGRLAIADIRATTRYAATLRELGAIDVTRRSLGWRFWYGNPFAATSLVTASKPMSSTLPLR